MGWVWKNEPEDDDSKECPINELGRIGNPNPRSDGDSGRFATRKVVRSQCRTEEVEPGKFLRKCERTEEILRDCVGRPAEVVQSNREYTEEDVTDQMQKGFLPVDSSRLRPFDFPGLRGDMEKIEKSFNFPGLRGDMDAIERGFISGIGRFFEAAEEMRDGFFGVFGDLNTFESKSSSSSSFSSSEESTSRGVPVESDDSREREFRSRNKPDSGRVDLSGLAKDV